MVDNAVRRDPSLPTFRGGFPMPTTLRSPRLSHLFAALAVLVLCACAAQPLGENIAPPRFVVGDHWEYLVTDGLRRGATTVDGHQMHGRDTGVDRDHASGVRRQLRPQRANRGDRRRWGSACRRVARCRSPAIFAIVEAARFSDRSTQLLAPGTRYVSQ